MQLASQNLKRASQLAATLDQIDQRSVGDRSVCWIGRYDTAEGGEPTRIALWANRPESQGGAIGIHLGQELPSFLDDARTADVDYLVLFLDSAGVSMYENWQGMQRCAEMIKQLHDINMNTDICTVAVLGEEIGCYGGALLIAGACQYQLASLNGRYGVSGSRVINHVTGDHAGERRPEPFCYWATYRLLNGELSSPLASTVDGLREQLLGLETQPLTLDYLRQRLSFLKQKLLEDNETLNQTLPAGTGVDMGSASSEGQPGFSGDKAIGCEDLLDFCDFIVQELDAGRQLPVLAGDAVQQFSLANEIRGFSACLSLTAALLRLAAQQHPLTAEVNEVGSGAAFIALSLMADDVRMADDARVYSLPPMVIEAFTGRPASEVCNGVNHG